MRRLFHNRTRASKTKKQIRSNKPAVRLNRRLDTWLLQHAQALVFSLGQLYRNPGGTLLTTAVIGISLALPAGFYSLLENAERVTTHWDAVSDISLFLTPDIDARETRDLASRLKDHADIESVRIISPEDAQAEYKQNSGFAAALDTLEFNPLPFVLVIRPHAASMSSAQNIHLLGSLSALPQVDSARFDWQWVQRLHRIIAVLQRIVMLVAAVLGLAMALVVGNTIRLAIYSRRQEIEINKLFGATDAFISRPFLYSGFIQGLGGSLIAWLLLECAMLLLEGPVSRLADLYDTRFILVTLSAGQLANLFLIGAGLGLAGSWLSVKRHIRTIDPG